MSDPLPLPSHLPEPGQVQPLIYAVDDQVRDLQTVGHWLQRSYRVRLFDSGAALLEALAEGPVPDLFLLDLLMPGMAGDELCTRLKADEATRDVPVLFLTAATDPDAESSAFHLGAEDYIPKPVRPEVLLARVQLHLKIRQTQRLLQQKNIDLDQQVRRNTGQLAEANQKLEQLVQIGLDMGVERDRMVLLRKIVQGGRHIANCVAGTVFLKTDHNTLRFEIRTNEEEPLPRAELPLYESSGEPIHRCVATHVALTGETVVIDDVYTETRFDLSGTKRFSEESGIRTISMLTVPMVPREGEVIGVVQFINALDPHSGAVTVFPPELLRMLQAMAAQAAVALDNLMLVESQQALMDSLFRLIAGAIDAKSPYTGGHCERVPELAFMLAREASEVQSGPLAAFGFSSESEWREFRIGAWLHDCGKVTSPEYVVDKATKLETIYNRIHEIRTRFEVLLRDAEILALKAIAGGEPADAAWAAFEARKAQLFDDFAFLAECNLGGEFMAPERIERLQRIADQTWWRHFDDRLGLADAELKRYPAGAPALPVQERLLTDRPEHLVPRTESPALDPQFGFQMKVPEYLYNRGEVHNLRIGRGTLTEEERFKINEHIIQTVVMLERLPLPRDLRRVPEYAGTHHETLIGTGYPRKLTDKDLSVPARIMAIADIFEALTANDRPYKKVKSLSESIRILHQFKKDRHIDPVLFDLFLQSGIYKAYADRFLMPEQIDEVDIAPYLG